MGQNFWPILYALRMRNWNFSGSLTTLVQSNQANATVSCAQHQTAFLFHLPEPFWRPPEVGNWREYVWPFE